MIIYGKRYFVACWCSREGVSLYQGIGLSGDLGMLRLGVAVPDMRIADVDYNVANIISLMREARGMGVQVLTLPEMAITGYTIGDLVFQKALLLKAREGLRRLREESAASKMLVAVGIPLAEEQKIFNCAAVLGAGCILAVLPKTSIPTYKEYYESRWFASSRDVTTESIELDGEIVPFGTDILIKLRGIPDATVGVEVCEDLWVPLAPHENQALAGATILLNLSASNEILGKAEWRRTLVSAESGRCIAAYAYVSCGIWESSNDVVFGGHALITENGNVLTESERLTGRAKLLVADIDLERLEHDRRVATTFGDAACRATAFRVVTADTSDPPPGDLRRALDARPFVPADPARRAERCRDIFAMQVAGLAEKLTGARKSRLVLGISGGLDSTLALLVAVKTMDFLKLPRSNVSAFTLPGFGTTERTRINATRLCQALGVSFKQVSITRSATAHLEDLDHKGDGDTVFENVQARYRTEFLFNKANELDGILLGTGDLTEIALGWSTFSGDQLSHYHVNASVPKTLVRYMVRWVAEEEIQDPSAAKVLVDIIETPISPELLRTTNGQILQKSEEIIGPVELADFYLYPFIRFGMRPGKLLYLADEARRRGLFEGRYTRDDLYRWLKSFIIRFFANQFKRTCMPEGPKVGTVSLSPRGDWRMPSDANAALWLEDLEKMYTRIRQESPGAGSPAGTMTSE